MSELVSDIGLSNFLSYCNTTSRVIVGSISVSVANPTRIISIGVGTTITPKMRVSVERAWIIVAKRRASAFRITTTGITRASTITIVGVCATTTVGTVTGVVAISRTATLPIGGFLLLEKLVLMGFCVGSVFQGTKVAHEFGRR